MMDDTLDRFVTSGMGQLSRPLKSNAATSDIVVTVEEDTETGAHPLLLILYKRLYLRVNMSPELLLGLDRIRNETAVRVWHGV
jgi:hypothetical protein